MKLTFELGEIQEAHAKVKSGADFPAYAREMSQLGVRKIETHVIDGHEVYVGREGFQIQSEGWHPDFEIADHGDPKKFAHYLELHQGGGSDFPTFCAHAAETGVEKWIVDLDVMSCSYFDKSNVKILEEHIPCV